MTEKKTKKPAKRKTSWNNFSIEQQTIKPLKHLTIAINLNQDYCKTHNCSVQRSKNVREKKKYRMQLRYLRSILRNELRGLSCIMRSVHRSCMSRTCFVSFSPNRDSLVNEKQAVFSSFFDNTKGEGRSTPRDQQPAKTGWVHDSLLSRQVLYTPPRSGMRRLKNKSSRLEENVVSIQSWREETLIRGHTLTEGFYKYNGH